MLRGLPDVRVWNVESNSPERKIVVVEYVGFPLDRCEGVLLAWDGVDRKWRSIYDCAAFSGIEIHDDTLSAALYAGIRPKEYDLRFRYLEVDLTTWLGELWNDPYGNFWRDSRVRPRR